LRRLVERDGRRRRRRNGRHGPHHAGSLRRQRRSGDPEIDLEPTRVYSRADAEEMAASASRGGDAAAALDDLDGAGMSAFVRAKKPA
jgi:hypothetical protein